ncbi:ABC transporter permease [Jatrophihabitans fulvus]
MAAGTKASSGSLRTYLITRLLLVIPMVWILVTLVFIVMRAIGDPIKSKYAGQLPPEEIERRRAAAGLTRPILSQYWDYLTGIVRFDFGTTITDNQPVSDLIITRGAATLELTFWAFLVALLIGIPLGRVAARHRDKLPDVGLRLFAIVCYAIPVFFLGLLLQLLFGQVLGWLPTNSRASSDVQQALETVDPNTHIYIINAILYGDPSYGWDVIEHTILPAITLGLLTGGIFIRLVRVNLLQTLRTDYVEAARARGVREGRVVRKHAFKNALIPVVTVMALQFATLLGGAVLTEKTFNWPGLGFTIAQYLDEKDFLAVQGIVAFIAVVVAIVSFLIDVITAIVDPRVRY